MLEWEQSSQHFQSNTLCSVTALRAKWLYMQPKTAVLTSEELHCSDMTPVWKHAMLSDDGGCVLAYLHSRFFFFFLWMGQFPLFKKILQQFVKA